MISDTIRRFATGYTKSKLEPYKYNDNADLLVKVLPDRLYNALEISRDEYHIKGSVGNGKWAEIPWFAIMHKGITTSTQTGYYIVGLFSKDLQTMYIALGLGWTQFQEQYGSKVGREKISEYAAKLAELLPNHDDYNQTPLDLGAASSRAKGYEVSNAIWKSLDIGSLDEDNLIYELKSLVGDYKFVMNRYGADLYFENELTTTEEPLEADLIKSIRTFSLSTDKPHALNNLQSIADTLPPLKKKRYVSAIIRNAAFADYVKERSNFICEICGRLPFIKSSGKPYAEADHVEPLYLQGRDHPDNMRCLCAQCHRILTYGSTLEVKALMDNKLS
jgi:5-methylcytosine-specific restriction protein A